VGDNIAGTGSVGEGFGKGVTGNNTNEEEEGDEVEEVAEEGVVGAGD